MIAQHNGRSQDDHRSDEELLDIAIAEFLRAESAGQAGDRQQWLARYPACASGLLEFFDDRQYVDQLTSPVRAQLSSSSGGSDPGSREMPNETIDFRPSVAKLTAARYRPIKFHARGGMGEIWLAEDKRIGRNVAIKKLRPGRKDRAARFTVEAQVTGQLEHPSVVPLHDMGVDESGDPYYVMKFIEGRQLSDAVADFHAQKSSIDWFRDVQFRKLLDTFINVCNAVAYAHSKGVLHRDIKPDNIMLGPYGETLVVDWGLAKVMGQPEQIPETSVRLSGGASTATQDGAIVGSPVYMSPEGAQGKIDEVDQSSDVYLLGATLYEILTAKPPRQGSSRSELIDLARKSNPMNPRRLDRRIPRTLEAICLKAMAFRKQDRYLTPLALADDVQRYLAGEPTTAYDEPWLARAGRWARRHRRHLLVGAGLLGAAALAVFAFTSYWQASTLAEREVARQKLIQFHRFANDAQFYAATSDSLLERTPYFDRSRAEESADRALTIANSWGPSAKQLPLDEERPALLRAQYGLLLRLVQLELLKDHSADDAKQVMALLDQAKSLGEVTRGYHELRGRSLERLGQTTAAKQEAELAAKEDSKQTADDLFLEAERFRAQDAGVAARFIAEGALPNREYLDRAVDKYRAALQLDPQHYWARFQLGRCLLARGQNAEAVEALSACIALRPAAPWALSVRGLAHVRSGNTVQALDDLNQAVQIDSTFLPGRLNRGFVQSLQGNTDAALADFEAALAAPEGKRLVEAAFYRGQIRLQQRRYSDALVDFSAVTEALPNFRPAYWLKGAALFRLGQYEAGEAAVNKFCALGEVEQSNDRLAEKHLGIGKLLRLLALELDGAARQEALVRAIDKLQSAISLGPPTAEMFQHLGAAQELLKRPLDAVATYSKGLDLSPDNIALLKLRGWAYLNSSQSKKAKDDFAAALRVAPNDAESHAGLGYAFAETGANVEARQEASTALLTGAENYLVLHDVACVYGRLSKSAEEPTENQNLAIALLKRAVALSKQVTGGPDESALIRQEEQAFPQALRARAEFQRILSAAEGN